MKKKTKTKCKKKPIENQSEIWQMSISEIKIVATEKNTHKSRNEMASFLRIEIGFCYVILLILISSWLRSHGF